MRQNIKVSRSTGISICMYIFIICMILNMRCILITSPQYDWMSSVIYIVAGISLIGGVILKGRISKSRIQRFIILMGIIIGYSGVFWLVDPIKSVNFFRIPLQLFLILFYCLFLEESTGETLKKYSNIVSFIAIISLSFWVFGSIFELIKPNGYLVSTWTGSARTINSYFNLYFEPQRMTFGGRVIVIRNCAFFAEAPMASLIFSIAFLQELIQDKINYKRCSLLLIAVVSTFSTTGITAVLLAFCLRYLFGKVNSVKELKFKMFVFPVIIFLCMSIGITLIISRLGTSSGTVRLDDFRAGYLAWIRSPIFGNGYGNSESIHQYMSSWRSTNMGLSNSVVQILAYGGIYLFAPYLISALYGCIGLVKRKKWLEFLFYFVFIYEFVLTIISFQMLTLYLFIAMFTVNSKSKIRNVSAAKICYYTVNNKNFKYEVLKKI